MAVVFFGFLLVGLNVIVGFGIYDVSLLPRLLALMVFLALSVPFFFRPNVFRRLDVSILRDPLLISFGSYTALTACSLVFAINPTAGFNDVFKTFGAYVVLCLSCLILPATPRWPVLLSRIVTLAAFGACGIGFYQMSTQCGFRLPTRTQAEAVTGLMSNVNLFAGFLNLLLPFCLCGLVIQRGFWRASSGFAAVATLCLIVLLQSRAAYISLAVGICVVLIALGVFRKRFGIGISRRAIVFLAAAGFCLLCGIFVFGSAINNPVAQRFRTLLTSDFSAIDGGRLMIWRLTLEMISDHFLTGVGAGNFTIRLHEYLGRPGQNFSGIITNWAQPHHDFLWVFAEKGVIGFLVFAGIFILAFLRGRAAFQAASQRDVAWIALFALMGLSAYISASCFDFPLERINQQVYLAVLLAVVTVAARDKAVAEQKASWPRLVFGALALAVLLLGTVYSIFAIRQEYHVNLARRAIRQGDFPSALGQSRLAATRWKTLDPVATPVSFLEGYALWKMGRVAEALPPLKSAREQNPNRSYILLYLGEAYLASGDTGQAIDCLGLAAKRYPQDNEISGALARAKAIGSKKPDAQKNLQNQP